MMNSFREDSDDSVVSSASASPSASSSVSYRSNESSSSSHSTACAQEETIALFGIHGSTGRHFVKLALDAGYRVRALAPTRSCVELQHDALVIVEGCMDDATKLQDVVEGAAFVVCMLGDTLPAAKEYQDNCLLDFCKTLYPLMKESCTRLFLYQANSLTIDTRGRAPVVSRVLKETGNLLKRRPQNKEHDNVVNHIVEQQNEYFHFIVTRPGMLRDGPSKKKLAASKSLPGPVPTTHVDLAAFSLGALVEEKLYNTCPYVVGDGF